MEAIENKEYLLLLIKCELDKLKWKIKVAETIMQYEIGKICLDSKRKVYAEYLGVNEEELERMIEE